MKSHENSGILPPVWFVRGAAMGQEFRVNTYQNNWQLNPDIIARPDGGFSVVWNSYFNEYDDGPTATYIAKADFDGAGRPSGREQFVFGRTQTSNYDPSITWLADGGYVVVWEYDDYDDIMTLKKQVMAQVHNADGSVRTAAFQVDGVPSMDAVLPQVFATAGGFCVTYGVNRAGVLFDQVYAHAYNAQGVSQGPDRLLNTNVGDFDQIETRTAHLRGGGTVVVWNSEASMTVPNTDLGSNEVRGTLLSDTGRVLRGDFSLCRNIGTVGSDNGDGYDVAALSDGGFVVSHRAFGDEVNNDILSNVVIETFDVRGRAVLAQVIGFFTPQVVISTRVTQMDSGEIVVVWQMQPEAQGKFGDDIMGRVFSEDGRAQTRVFQISQDRGNFDDQTNPEVVALAGGGFAVTYVSDTVDNDHEGIAARIYGRGTAAAERLGVDQSGSMAGLGGNDTLTGNAAANSLAGGAGRDVLTGRGGADSFVFDRPQGVDRITDFTGADRIVLQGAGFGDLGHGALSATLFRSFGHADAGDRIIYNQDTGTLFFDANGSGAGGRVQFAGLEPGTALMAADFWVM
jgi:Ca2+-binding RTX toxin-like protein